MNHTIVGRRAKKLGRSGLLASVFLLLFTGVAIAAIFSIIRLGIEGNVKDVHGPDMVLAVTNDDGTPDYPSFDSDDDGSDPAGPAGSGIPRLDFNVQNCTATINGGSVDVHLIDTHDDAYCSVRVTVENNGSDSLSLVDATFSGNAPLEISLNTASACGYTLNSGEQGNIIIDVTPTTGATGSWSKADNTVDVRWGLTGTFVCP